MKKFAVLVLLLAAAALPLPAVTVTVAVDRPGAAINPAMWGVFFEDINFGADGGLYAELVKNPSFEFPQPLMGWTVPAESGAVTTLTVKSDDNGGHCLRVEVAGPAGAVENEGFRGIGLHAGESYDFSVRVRHATAAALRVDLVGPSGAVLGSARLAGLGEAWTQRTATLVAWQTEGGARLRLTLEGAGAAELDRVSLFPHRTWKQRPRGLRADMVQALADLGPGFVRFPGGCIVEGSVLDRRYQWKKTIGPVEDRALLFNRWNAEIKLRPTPDYFQTFGLGFYEYFILCEDLGAAPLPILNCGMACQFNSKELAPLDGLNPYIQDALDLIEFANGPVTSPWGARRAELGHPAPFQLTMLGVGNEQWGPQYIERFARFATALRAKHPEIALIGAAGPEPADERFKFLWPKLSELKADFIDEHCYAAPDWFLDNAHRYDAYDRSGPKVFMGEYAAQSVAVVSPQNRNTWLCALSEAAYMTGLERNADVVRMASYAPLFAHVDAWQWTPNLIWVDNLHVMPTPSYRVQRLFARNRGDRVLPVALSGANVEETRRFYASSTFDDAAGEAIVKLVNATAAPATCTVELAGVRRVFRGRLTTLRADDTGAPLPCAPVDNAVLHEAEFAPAGPKFEIVLPAGSLSVVRLGVGR